MLEGRAGTEVASSKGAAGKQEGGLRAMFED